MYFARETAPGGALLSSHCSPCGFFPFHRACQRAACTERKHTRAMFTHSHMCMYRHDIRIHHYAHHMAHWEPGLMLEASGATKAFELFHIGVRQVPTVEPAATPNTNRMMLIKTAVLFLLFLSSFHFVRPRTGRKARHRSEPAS